MSLPKIIQLGRGVFGRQAIDNMGWIDMGNYIVVIDTLEQRKLAGDVVSQIHHTIGNKPVRYVINTHLHYDHIALNPHFERLGAEIVNARTLNSKFTLGKKHSSNYLEIIPLPGLHTKDDIIINLPNQKITFIGDLFGWGILPFEGKLTREKLQQIYDGYQTILDLEPEAIVQGHGPFITPSELIRCRQYFQETLFQLENGETPPAT